MTYIPPLNHELLNHLPNNIKSLVSKARQTRGGNSWVSELTPNGNQFLDDNLCAVVELNNNFMLQLDEDWEKENKYFKIPLIQWAVLTEEELLNAGFVLHERKTEEKISVYHPNGFLTETVLPMK